MPKEGMYEQWLSQYEKRKLAEQQSLLLVFEALTDQLDGVNDEEILPLRSELHAARSLLARPLPALTPVRLIGVNCGDQPERVARRREFIDTVSRELRLPPLPDPTVDRSSAWLLPDENDTQAWTFMLNQLSSHPQIPVVQYIQPSGDSQSHSLQREAGGLLARLPFFHPSQPSTFESGHAAQNSSLYILWGDCVRLDDGMGIVRGMFNEDNICLYAYNMHAPPHNPHQE